MRVSRTGPSVKYLPRQLVWPIGAIGAQYRRSGLDRRNIGQAGTVSALPPAPFEAEKRKLLGVGQNALVDPGQVATVPAALKGRDHLGIELLAGLVQDFREGLLEGES